MMNHKVSGAPNTCSLNEAEFLKRRSAARDTLLPSIESVSRIINGVIFKFHKHPKIRSDVTEFVRLERQCCGFLTFTITPPAGHEDSSVAVKIEGPETAAAAIEVFAQAGFSALRK